VSEALDEVILGIDWLTQNRCRWDFGRGAIEVNGKWLRLYHRTARKAVRRIYAGETATIPAGRQMDVSVHITWPNLHQADGDLMLEPRVFNSGIVGARTLLEGQTFRSAVRILNLSETDFVLRKTPS
jgi:hypothetical protein